MVQREGLLLRAKLDAIVETPESLTRNGFATDDGKYRFEVLVDAHFEILRGDTVLQWTQREDVVVAPSEGAAVQAWRRETGFTTFTPADHRCTFECRCSLIRGTVNIYACPVSGIIHRCAQSSPCIAMYTRHNGERACIMSGRTSGVARVDDKDWGPFKFAGVYENESLVYQKPVIVPYRGERCQQDIEYRRLVLAKFMRMYNLARMSPKMTSQSCVSPVQRPMSAPVGMMQLNLLDRPTDDDDVPGTPGRDVRRTGSMSSVVTRPGSPVAISTTSTRRHTPYVAAVSRTRQAKLRHAPSVSSPRPDDAGLLANDRVLLSLNSLARDAMTNSAAIAKKSQDQSVVKTQAPVVTSMGITSEDEPCCYRWIVNDIAANTPDQLRGSVFAAIDWLYNKQTATAINNQSFEFTFTSKLVGAIKTENRQRKFTVQRCTTFVLDRVNEYLPDTLRIDPYVDPYDITPHRDDLCTKICSIIVMVNSLAERFGSHNDYNQHDTVTVAVAVMYLLSKGSSSDGMVFIDRDPVVSNTIPNKSRLGRLGKVPQTNHVVEVHATTMARRAITQVITAALALGATVDDLTYRYNTVRVQMGRTPTRSMRERTTSSIDSPFVHEIAQLIGDLNMR